MDTWGISGPQFLLLYVALFAVTVAVVGLARRRALAGAAVPARLDPMRPPSSTAGARWSPPPPSPACSGTAS
jgi:hypothetical protein